MPEPLLGVSFYHSFSSIIQFFMTEYKRNTVFLCSSPFTSKGLFPIAGKNRKTEILCQKDLCTGRQEICRCAFYYKADCENFASNILTAILIPLCLQSAQPAHTPPKPQAKPHTPLV